ncbi:uncharacterized protein ACBT57_022634 isoform 1-T1 [Dama dama]
MPPGGGSRRPRQAGPTSRPCSPRDAPTRPLVPEAGLHDAPELKTHLDPAVPAGPAPPEVKLVWVSRTQMRLLELSPSSLTRDLWSIRGAGCKSAPAPRLRRRAGAAETPGTRPFTPEH